MRLIVAGGGTGGHIFPGIAVAQQFVALAHSPRVLFVGTKNGLEGRLVPPAGFSLYLIPASGLKGKSWTYKLRGLCILPLSFIEALRVILSFNPDVILGVGGYASAAVCIVARLMGVPVAIQEQNAMPGATNRWLAKIAWRVFVAFPGSEKHFPAHKTELTGNPIRQDILSVPQMRLPDSGPLQIFVFGGSQGAAALNQALMQALPMLGDLKDRLRFTHQTGEKDCEAVRQAYAAHGFTAEVSAFIHDMASVYRRTHLAICRSGAGILELAACGIPAILIPFPFAADDHQAANARVFQEAGAAITVRNAEFTGERCAELLRGLSHDLPRLQKMGQAALQLGRRGAAQAIAEGCIALAATHVKKPDAGVAGQKHA